MTSSLPRWNRCPCLTSRSSIVLLQPVGTLTAVCQKDARFCNKKSVHYGHVWSSLKCSCSKGAPPKCPPPTPNRSSRNSGTTATSSATTPLLRRLRRAAHLPPLPQNGR